MIALQVPTEGVRQEWKAMVHQIDEALMVLKVDQLIDEDTQGQMVEDLQRGMANQVMTDEVLLTGEDLLMEEDHLQTGEGLLRIEGDLLRTEEDLLRTGEDLLRTGEDLPMTGEDHPMTGEDHPKTGEDHLKTGEDLMAWMGVVLPWIEEDLLVEKVQTGEDPKIWIEDLEWAQMVMVPPWTGRWICRGEGQECHIMTKMALVMISLLVLDDACIKVVVLLVGWTRWNKSLDSLLLSTACHLLQEQN